MNTSYPKELYQSRIYMSWTNMKRRCKNRELSRYGGRGISYDSNWEHFVDFYKDMGDSYADNLTLERIDNDKGYSKENCKWATPIEQANNRTSSVFFTISGIKKTLAEWIKESGLKSSTVRQRLYVYGWTIEDSLTTPLHQGRRI